MPTDSGGYWFKEYEAAARALKIPLQSLEVRAGAVWTAHFGLRPRGA